MAALQRRPIYTAEERFAKEVIKQAKAILTRKFKNASRELYNSITFIITDYGVEFSYANQGLFIETGRKRGAKMPPTKSIKDWAKQKGLGQWRDKKGRYISNDAQAFIIAKSIKEKGIKPLAWFSDPLERAMAKLSLIHI